MIGLVHFEQSIDLGPVQGGGSGCRPDEVQTIAKKV
jgi:hypothetical protein